MTDNNKVIIDHVLADQRFYTLLLTVGYPKAPFTVEVHTKNENGSAEVYIFCDDGFVGAKNFDLTFASKQEALSFIYTNFDLRDFIEAQIDFSKLEENSPRNWQHFLSVATAIPNWEHPLYKNKTHNTLKP